MLRSGATLACFVVVFSGCAAAGTGKKASPIEWGFSFHAVPAFDVGTDGATSVHPLLGYNYLNYDGGHDNIYQLGGQLRRSVVDSPLWYGGEFAYDRFTSSTDGATFDEPSWNGFNLGGLIGYELDTSFATSSLFGSFSRVQFLGTDGFDGWGGWLFKVGYEVQPDLFNR